MARNFLIFLAILALEFSYLEAASNSDLSRIANGQDAAVGQFPHQVDIQRKGRHNCGGSILNERYILTAAHCVSKKASEESNKPIPDDGFQIRAGSVSRSSGGQLLNIKRTIIHENYTNYKELDDIALIELEKPLELSDNVKPIEMATEEVPSGEDIIVSGWGQTNKNSPYPDHLQWTTLKSITTKECLKSFSYVDDRVICLGHHLKRRACSGDSGGPATYKGKLVGVCSFGWIPCVIESGTSNGYTKVSHYHSWILEKMNERIDEEIQ